MSLLGDLNRHLGEETLEIEKILRREQYVRRLLFAEGTDPRVEAAWRSVRARRAGRDSVYTDEELFVPKRIILVGGTGSGKSFVLKRAYVGAVRRFGAEQPAPFFLDLDANLGTRLDVVEALESKYEGMFSRALAEHKPGCYLMLDSLDDRVLRSGSRFVNDLKQFLHKLGRHTAGCIIACRRAAFDPDWFRNSRLGLETFHVDHLSHEEFRQILPDDAQRMAFFVECNRLGISELLSMPFDGFYLARRFAAGKALPTTRRDCLNGRIDEMLLGTPEDRKTGSEPPPARLRAIARHLACLATFTEGGSWTRQDVVDHLSESAAILGSEPIKPEEVRALFERPMFVRAGPRFTFVHQLYRELLAAEALRSLPAQAKTAAGDGIARLSADMHSVSRRRGIPGRGLPGIRRPTHRGRSTGRSVRREPLAPPGTRGAVAHPHLRVSGARPAISVVDGPTSRRTTPERAEQAPPR